MALANVPAKVILFQKNAQIFEVDGLHDNTGAYLNAATVTLAVADQNGAIVLSSTPMAYVAASNGIYQGQIPASFTPKTGQGYSLIIDATQGAAVGHWEFLAEVDIRRA